MNYQERCEQRAKIREERVRRTGRDKTTDQSQDPSGNPRPPADDLPPFKVDDGQAAEDAVE